MSHQFLFFVPELKRGDANVRLSGDEHHHLTRVLRVARNAEVAVTNGDGLIVSAVVESIDRAAAALSVVAVLVDSEPEPEFTLALALVKKDRFEVALEQCVELGITDCLPFISGNVQVKPFAPAFMDRLRRIGVSAMKQSFRATLPKIHEPVSFAELMQRAGAHDRIVVGDQNGPACPALAADQSICAVIGPEAGLTDGESAALRDAGATLAAVTSRRLRAGTAAVALVAAVQARR